MFVQMIRLSLVRILCTLSVFNFKTECLLALLWWLGSPFEGSNSAPDRLTSLSEEHTLMQKIGFGARKERARMLEVLERARWTWADLLFTVSH
jgi:hypothetical protein